MSSKDLTEKMLEDYNDVFADILNVLVFDGERLIQPAMLSNSSLHSMYKSDTGRLHELERDVMKT